MSNHTHPWDERRIRIARLRLLEWFDELRRELPWRESADPYRIWVSEIMLQQTQVKTVVPYYRRWMERFPTLATLARASQEEVLRQWQGLGYYSRARNLHRAAREVDASWGGVLPTSASELRTLPGIGEYTAGAVASIAFGRVEPAVDGNVRRVLARLMNDPDPTPSRLRGWAAGLVDPDRPGEFNEAMMELGSLVCTPRSPSCSSCPLESQCASRAAGTQEDRPAPKRRVAVPRLTEVVLLLWRGSPAGPAVLLRRRPEDGLLGGMWECPSVERNGGTPATASIRTILGQLPGTHANSTGIDPARAIPLMGVDHVFSHRRVRYLPHRLELETGEEARFGPLERPLMTHGGVPYRWVLLNERSQVPLPVAQETILSALGSVLGKDAAGVEPS